MTSRLTLMLLENVQNHPDSEILFSSIENSISGTEILLRWINFHMNSYNLSFRTLDIDVDVLSLLMDKIFPKVGFQICLQQSPLMKEALFKELVNSQGYEIDNFQSQDKIIQFLCQVFLNSSKLPKTNTPTRNSEVRQTVNLSDIDKLLQQASSPRESYNPRQSVPPISDINQLLKRASEPVKIENSRIRGSRTNLSDIDKLLQQTSSNSQPKQVSEIDRLLQKASITSSTTQQSKPISDIDKLLQQSKSTNSPPQQRQISDIDKLLQQSSGGQRSSTNISDIDKLLQQASTNSPQQQRQISDIDKLLQLSGGGKPIQNVESDIDKLLRRASSSRERTSPQQQRQISDIDKLLQQSEGQRSSTELSDIDKLLLKSSNSPQQSTSSQTKTKPISDIDRLLQQSSGGQRSTTNISDIDKLLQQASSSPQQQPKPKTPQLQKQISDIDRLLQQSGGGKPIQKVESNIDKLLRQASGGQNGFDLPPPDQSFLLEDTNEIPKESDIDKLLRQASGGQNEFDLPPPDQSFLLEDEIPKETDIDKLLRQASGVGQNEFDLPPPDPSLINQNTSEIDRLMMIDSDLDKLLMIAKGDSFTESVTSSMISENLDIDKLLSTQTMGEETSEVDSEEYLKKQIEEKKKIIQKLQEQIESGYKPAPIIKIDPPTEEQELALISTIKSGAKLVESFGKLTMMISRVMKPFGDGGRLNRRVIDLIQQVQRYCDSLSRIQSKHSVVFLEAILISLLQAEELPKMTEDIIWRLSTEIESGIKESVDSIYNTMKAVLLLLRNEGIVKSSNYDFIDAITSMFNQFVYSHILRTEISNSITKKTNGDNEIILDTLDRLIYGIPNIQRVKDSLNIAFEKMGIYIEVNEMIDNANLIAFSKTLRHVMTAAMANTTKHKVETAIEPRFSYRYQNIENILNFPRNELIFLVASLDVSNTRDSVETLSSYIFDFSEGMGKTMEIINQIVSIVSITSDKSKMFLQETDVMERLLTKFCVRYGGDMMRNILLDFMIFVERIDFIELESGIYQNIEKSINSLNQLFEKLITSIYNSTNYIPDEIIAICNIIYKNTNEDNSVLSSFIFNLFCKAVEDPCGYGILPELPKDIMQNNLKYLSRCVKSFILNNRTLPQCLSNVSNKLKSGLTEFLEKLIEKNPIPIIYPCNDFLRIDEEDMTEPQAFATEFFNAINGSNEPNFTNESGIQQLYEVIDNYLGVIDNAKKISSLLDQVKKAFVEVITVAPMRKNPLKRRPTVRKGTVHEVVEGRKFESFTHWVNIWNDKTTIDGNVYIGKLSSNGKKVKNWKKMWIAIKHNLFVIFDTKPKSKQQRPRNCFPISKAWRISNINTSVNTSGKKNVIVIKFHETQGSIYISFNKPVESVHWIQALNKVKKQY